MKRFFAILCATVTLIACTPDQGMFHIDGQIEGAKGKTLYFESATLQGINTLDSTSLGQDGKFSFSHKGTSHPEFYRLRIEGDLIHLVVDSTEQLTVTAQWPHMATQYTIEGSEHNGQIKELALKQLALKQRIQDISSRSSISIGEQSRLIEEAIASYKADVKANHILSNPASPAAYFALFQTIGSQLIFNPIDNPDDVKYVAAVATAWDELYPDCDRTHNLHNIAIQGLANTKRHMGTPLSQISPDKISQTGIIDIALPDRKGQVRYLSQLKDKVVMLDFTAYSLPHSQERTLQLRKLYERFAPQGFEIFQVSIDPDEHYWKTVSEHLPWLCVYDRQGEESGLLLSYRVARIPCYFLIDKHGDLLARDEQIDDLEATIARLCAQ